MYIDGWVGYKWRLGGDGVRADTQAAAARFTCGVIPTKPKRYTASASDETTQLYHEVCG